ncbi:MAG: hypothetical protein LBG87_03205 [Spirochaetaceae bacterium]|jgi:RNA polymerase sigma factor|nr:hypothetical protein [Spirochaetaceae bacterium]
MQEVTPVLTDQIDEAKTDKEAMGRLVREYMPFIRKCVSGVFFKKELQEEYATEGMLGFLQSLQTYRSESGAFMPYARTVIRNRLLNAARREAFVQKLFFRKPLSADDDSEGHSFLEYEIVQRQYETAVEQASLQAEIAEINAEFAGWDFDVGDLALHRPKQDRSRLTCQRIACAVIADGVLVSEMKAARKLPIKKIAALTGCKEKILEKYRRYIAALILIQTGDYPYIQSFLPRKSEETL